MTHFLWFKNLTNLNVMEETLDVYRCCRVPFGIICSPFLLAGTIKYHLRKSILLSHQKFVIIFMLIMFY